MFTYIIVLLVGILIGAYAHKYSQTLTVEAEEEFKNIFKDKK